MKLWDKGKATNEDILNFTAGKDRILDLDLAAADVVASMAHVTMLWKIGILSETEKNALHGSLTEIYTEISEGSFKIGQAMEDIHSQVEATLTEKLGDTGKKVHTARSRNDQVITDLKLYYRHEVVQIVRQVESLVNILLGLSEKTKNNLIPGYTHFQAAMPSSFGLWFGSWAEALTEDIQILTGIFSYINQNPLGSAAGYGSSFPIDRELTTRLLEFNDMHINSINAQLSRGKTEKFLLSGLSAIAGSLSKMSMDLVLYMSQNFNFLFLNETLTTGSSIMPHKKNPDVLELIRAKCNLIQAREFEVSSVINNLPSGYHRDFQLLKEITFPALTDLKSCLDMMELVVVNLNINKDVIKQDIYRYISSVEAINGKVMTGIPFRKAYGLVASDIEQGVFNPGVKVDYTHIGSIGNLGTERIRAKLSRVLEFYEIEKYSGFMERFVEKIKIELDHGTKDSKG